MRSAILCLLALSLDLIGAGVPAQISGESLSASSAAPMPWLDAKRTPDERAASALAQMTQDEKIQLVHGSEGIDAASPGRSNGGAGFVPGIPRLKLPDLNMADSTVGVARGALRGRYSTLMPAAIAEASAWSPQLSYDYGALIGRELRAQGYNVSLAGGANLLREPRNGRSFEYRGEDPVLTGRLVAQAIRGLQDQHVIGDIKHYALNDQETGREYGNVVIDYPAARESDLLAFEIGVKEGEPGMVMCSYNKVNGDWSCENDELLKRTLKQEWGFRGFVLSDWGATHSAAKAINAGLDQEQPMAAHFGEALRKAIADGQVTQARLDDAARRILRTMFALGVVDDPPRPQVVDIYDGFAVAQRVAESGSILLKNSGVLPLKRGGSVAVIGGHADVGVLTGGGSGQVDPPGGNAAKPTQGAFSRGIWYPSSPLRALEAAAPGTHFLFDDGTDAARAAQAAASADIAIVFASQHASEGIDAANLSLPLDQDAMITAVTNANNRSVVVLETGGPVTMPWLDKTNAVVEVWYPGSRGGEAIARLLYGDANFSGKLPITFPHSEADLPNRTIAGATLKRVPVDDPTLPAGRRRWDLPPFDITYPEGAKVGYKWYDAMGKSPLFGFGYGLSYTSYAYSNLTVTSRDVTFTVTNTGQRQGSETAQVYVTLPAGARYAPKQLVGWANVPLAPGEAKAVAVKLEPLFMSIYDSKTRRWVRPKGRYQVYVGSSEHDVALAGNFKTRRQ
jgi:beta-glucosidase